MTGEQVGTNIFNKIICFFKGHKPHNHYRDLNGPTAKAYEGLPCERCWKVLSVRLKPLDVNTFPFFVDGPNGVVALTGNEPISDSINKLRERQINEYTYNWYRQDFPPTIYDGVATSSDGAFEVRIGGVTHGVVSGDSPAFGTSCGHFHSLDDAKFALIKQFVANEDKYLVHKTPVGNFKPNGGFSSWMVK